MRTFFFKLLRSIVKSAIFFYCKIVYHAEVIGTQNIPMNEPLIFCGNHRNYLDPPLMVATAKRHVRFMAKEELKKNLFLAFLGVVFEAIYVRRDAKDISALKTALKALKDGECIALFPEGTRNGVEKGEKVKDGASFLTLRTGARVIPVGITGGKKRFDKVTIHYGKPLDFTEFSDQKQNKDVLDRITQTIMDNIMQLTNEKN